MKEKYIGQKENKKRKKKVRERGSERRYKGG